MGGVARSQRSRLTVSAVGRDALTADTKRSGGDEELRLWASKRRALSPIR